MQLHKGTSLGLGGWRINIDGVEGIYIFEARGKQDKNTIETRLNVKEDKKKNPVNLELI